MRSSGWVLVYANDRINGVDRFMQPTCQVHPLPFGAINDKIVNTNDTILDPLHPDVHQSCSDPNVA